MNKKSFKEKISRNYVLLELFDLNDTTFTIICHLGAFMNALAGELAKIIDMFLYVILEKSY